MPESIITTEVLIENEPRSTVGMTTRVVKGSLWTLLGQILPLFASLISTPIVIRLLGSESYGVLILIGIIPRYLTFADFGMSIASTKFGSEAYAKGSLEAEAEIVKTAALIAFLTSLPIGTALFLFSFTVISRLNVPEYLQSSASVALKITAVSFVIGILSQIFNTPQLSRLRMDLDTFINATAKILLAILIPLSLYLGGGLVLAATVTLIINFLSLGANIIVSGRLIKELYRPTIKRKAIKPLIKFGGALVISAVAGLLLINIEKLVLAHVGSVKALAYYSVAFTFSTLATMFSIAMVQSLIPAFSQLLAPQKKSELETLFHRCIRINLVGMLPVIMGLFVIAKPFFTVWAGEDFGRESTIPLYVLLVGLFFNMLAYTPHSIITASGRTDILAKVYWIEFFPYVTLLFVLIEYFGAVGAAMAWSLRVIIDAIALVWFAKKVSGISFHLFQLGGLNFIAAICLLLPPIVWAAFESNLSIWLVFLTLMSLAAYIIFTWKKFITIEERLWLLGVLGKYFK